MSDEMTFRCPVCHATQTLRDTCRRCQADLRLLARAKRRVAFVKCLSEQARSSGDEARERTLAAELRWLLPRSDGLT
jgi:hypothetical protein